MQKPFDVASAFRTLRIRRRNALDLLKSMMTFLALELVERHGSPQKGLGIRLIPILEVEKNWRQRVFVTRKVKGFLPPDSGSSGPQVERTDKTEVVKEAFFFRR